MFESIWDKLAIKYDRLWVQKYSLTPTRNKIIQVISGLKRSDVLSLLDIGCGTGQLISDLQKIYRNADYIGIDKSQQMIEFARNKNLSAEFYVTTVENCDLINKKFDFITCCHSFPYYENKKLVVNKIKNYLKDNGYAIFIQASINNLWDKLVLWGVEKTAEKAEYLSCEDFKNHFKNDFELVDEFQIKEKFFMPTIAGFVLRKK